MLDTVILTIPKKRFCLFDDKFSPSFESLENAIRFARCINNPTAEDKKTGNYKPRLTAFKRGYLIELRIEFSAPKLLFGNNISELKENDLDKLISVLHEKLMEMGIGIRTKDLEQASVSGFHVSKNLVLTDGYTAGFVISELSKINFNQKMDLEKTNFRNNGDLLQFYSNRHSLVFYDKMADFKKPKKRAIDKDQTKQQAGLFDSLEKNKAEILRIEVRLSHKRKMNEILQKIDCEPNPMFKDIFNKDVCQKILKFYWNNFFTNNLFLFSTCNNPQKLLQMILSKFPKTKPRTAVFLMGLLVLCKDDSGIQGFRNIIKNYKPKSWPGLRKYLKGFEDNIFKYPQHGFVKDIETAIDEFRSYKLPKSYPLAM